jgi:hypothetical protein
MRNLITIIILGVIRRVVQDASILSFEQLQDIELVSHPDRRRIWTRGKVPCWKSDWRGSRCASRT